MGSCNPISNDDVVGTYINCNYGYARHFVEIPYKADTLILNSDFTFESGYFGKGRYQLNNQVLELKYTYELGVASFTAPVENSIFGSLKIILDEDQNHHYKKID